MFTLHVDTIGHYQCKPHPSQDVLHSSFWSTEIYTVPVLCILGATPTGQKTCVHIHGQFPYLLVPVSRTKADDSYLHTFAAGLEDAIRTAAGPCLTNTHYVFNVSLITGRLKIGDKEVQHYMKVCFYDPDILLKATHVLQDGAVMNTPFHPWGAHIPFFLQLMLCTIVFEYFGYLDDPWILLARFVIDHQIHDGSHLHFSTSKLRQLHRGHDEQEVSRLTGDECPVAGDLALVRWRSLDEVLSVTSSSQCNMWSTAAPALLGQVDNMPSEVLSSAHVELHRYRGLEVDVKAEDTVHCQELYGREPTELSVDKLGGFVEGESSRFRLLYCTASSRDGLDCGTVDSSQSFLENHPSVSDRHDGPFRVDSEDDCSMEDSDCDNETDEEEEEKDDSDWEIPQLDGTSDDTTASKKPSKKRAGGKNSKLGTKSGGSGREDSSSQGEGSNPSCSPQVQSPVMAPGGETPVPREQGVMSPYRHQQGGFPYQGGYYRQQWGESAMAPGFTSMSPYPGYHSASSGWGQSVPPHGSYPFMHRFPGNSFGYYPYPRHHPYNASFRQNGAPSSRQQSNFSPPTCTPMSPPAYPNSGPSIPPHSNSQQYAHFMSPQVAAMRRHSDGSFAQQHDRQFNTSTDWQYPVPVFNSWGYAQGSGPVQGMPQGAVSSVPSGSFQGMPSGPAESMPSGSAQSMPSRTVQSVSPGMVQVMPSGCVRSVSPGSVVPSGPVQKVSSESTVPSVSVHSMSTGSAVLPEPIQSMSSGSVMPSGSVQGMTSGSTMPSGALISMSSESVTMEGMPTEPVKCPSSESTVSVPSEHAQSRLLESVQDLSTESPQIIPAMPKQSMSSGSVQAISSESPQSVSSGSVPSNLNDPVHGISSAPVHDMPPLSIHGKGQECTLQLTQAGSSPSAQDMSSKPIPDTPPGSTCSLPSESFSESTQIMSPGMLQDMHSGSAQAVSTNSRSIGSPSPISTSGNLPFAVSQSMDMSISSSRSPVDKLQDISCTVVSCTSEISSSISPVSSMCVSSSAMTPGLLSRSVNSSPEVSANSSVHFTIVSSQDNFLGEAKPVDSSHAAPLQSSSDVSFGSSVSPSGYTNSGSCPSVSSRSSYAVSAGSFQDISSNWWSFQGGPRPLYNNPVGHCQFSQVQNDTMAGQRHHGLGHSNLQTIGGFSQPNSLPNQIPSGQRQTSPMSIIQKPFRQGQQCGVQNMPDHATQSQTFPMQDNTLTGPRYPCPAQNVRSPIGQRFSDSTQKMYNRFGLKHPFPPQNTHMSLGQRQTGPVQDSGCSQMGKGQNSAHTFSSDNRRQLQIPTGPAPSQTLLPCDRSQWQDKGNHPSTLQELLSAPDDSAAPSSRGLSTATSKRAVSMDCSPSDLYTPTAKGPESHEAARLEFKQPQKRSGSFSSPLSLSCGNSAPSALSNLYNFVSNVDPMARIPTPTSRNSTPSSTPHSDPSPNLSYRQDDDAGPTEVGLGPAKWQAHLSSPQAPSPRSVSVDELFGSSAKQLPATAPPFESSSVSSNRSSSASKEAAKDSDEPQIKQQTEVLEENEKGRRKDRTTDTQMVRKDRTTDTQMVRKDRTTDTQMVRKDRTTDTQMVRKDRTTDTQMVSSRKEVSCDSSDTTVSVTDCKITKKEIGSRTAGSGKKESGSKTASSSGLSGASERLGKQSRMKKLGLTLNTTRRMSDDRVNSPPVTPSPCAAYTFTFHVPTPVYKRFKMCTIFPHRASPDVKLVRMHPMDARRYSLLKIGRELVRVRRLSPKDVLTKAETSPASCTNDPCSFTDEHNSLIDPHTGELLCPLPGVGGEKDQLKTESLPQIDSSEQSGHLVDPQCMSAPRVMAEGGCQTSLLSPDPNDSQEQKLHVASTDFVTAPTNQTHNPHIDMGNNSGQSWQTLDRDRRPSVKVEYPAQRGNDGSSQWACGQPGQPPSQSWAGGMWGASSGGPAQWGEQWQNSSQPPGWNPNHGSQAYNYGTWMGGGAGYQQPVSSSMYSYNTWSPSVQSFTTQPSVSTPHCQSVTAGSTSASGQGSMGAMGQGQDYPQGYPHYSSGGYNQQAAFSHSGHHSAGGKFASRVGSGMASEHFPYHGAPHPQNYSHSMGHNQYHCNYSPSGYEPTGSGRKGMCQSGFSVAQQQHQQPVGGTTGLPQQYGQCGNPSNVEPGRGYNVTGPAPTLPSAPPHGPGPGPGPAQFAGQPTHMYSPPHQQYPFMSPSQQPGHFLQPSQFTHQSGQFSPLGQTNSGSTYSPRDQQVHVGNQPCSVSETSSQEHLCQDSRQQKQVCDSVTQQGQQLMVQGHQDQHKDKSEGNGSHPEARDAFIGGHDSHTSEQKSFLQQVACQALTTTVCESSACSTQKPQSDRPEINVFDTSTDISEESSTVQNTNGIGGNDAKQLESKYGSFDENVESATFENEDDKCNMKRKKKSASKCMLKDKGSGNSYNDKQQLRKAVTPCSRQNVRRSSVQLWSDGDSDSGEENSEENEESSDDYRPSCRSKRKGRKRKRSRHQNRTEVKRKKRSSVNYSPHAFSKYLDHGFEKKRSPRLRQSYNQKLKKRKRKDDSLIEGVHYIVVGKFKGHRVMLVKVDRVKVKVDEIVKVTDGLRTGGKSQVTTPRRLQGPRCRRIAKGTPPDDPCFVQTADSVNFEAEREECGESACEEKDVSLTPASTSNHKMKSASCVKIEDCDLKKAIKQETDDTDYLDHVKGDVSHLIIKTEHTEDTVAASVHATENGSAKASALQLKSEDVVSPQQDESKESKDEPGHRTECDSSCVLFQQVECVSTEESTDRFSAEESTDRRQCAVKDIDTTACTQFGDKGEQQGDSSDRKDHNVLDLQRASQFVGKKPDVDAESEGDFMDRSCVLTDSEMCITQPAVQNQSSMLLSENDHPVKSMSSAVSLSLLEGQTC